VHASQRRPAWQAQWTVAEVFAGVGSVARGFAAAGFQVAYLNDIDPVARGPLTVPTTVPAGSTSCVTSGQSPSQYPARC